MKSSDTRRRRFKRFYRRVIAFIDRGVHFRRIDSELGRRERKPVKLLGICRDRLVAITADGFDDLYGSTIDVFFYVALCGHKFFELCLKIIRLLVQPKRHRQSLKQSTQPPTSTGRAS